MVDQYKFRTFEPTEKIKDSIMKTQHSKAKLNQDINTLKNKLKKSKTSKEVSRLSTSISKLESFRDNLTEQENY